MNIVQDFDSKRYFLGRLCLRQHEWQSTGKSLRNYSRKECVECCKIKGKRSPQTYTICGLQKSDIDECIQRYNLGEPLISLGCYYKVAPQTIAYHLRQNGVSIAERGNRETDRDSVLTQKEFQIIEGELLGDGYLRKTKTSIHVAFGHTTIHEGYRQYLVENLSILKDALLMQYEKKESIRNGKISVHQAQFKVQSKSDRCLSRFFSRWYPEGKKIVPQDLILTSTVALHWYLGDGWLSKRNVNGRVYKQIGLATNCFLEEDVDFLIFQLKENGISAVRQKRNSISIPVKSHSSFLNFIGESPVKGLSYRWG